MSIVEIIRLIAGFIFIFVGLLTIILAIIGVYRFNYVLNRMHLAATCDTMGMLFILIGLVILEGLTFTTLKLMCIVVFFWLSSPICSHLICDAEVETNSKINEECEDIEV